MSEPEKSKRKFWQFHLSTLVVAIISLNSLICINCIANTSNHRNKYERWEEIRYGWPATFYLHFSLHRPNLIPSEQFAFLIDPENEGIQCAGLGIDASVAAIIALIGILIPERLIRRREQRSAKP